MEPDYKWIAQDECGAIWFFNTKPEPMRAFNAFYAADNKRAEIGSHNPNWSDSLIDLGKEDYEIVDGILVRKPKAEVSRSELTDTELLDAIVKHELRVDVNGSKVEVISGSIPGAVTINKKGNIRKAIKKWLRKNVDTKPVEDDVSYHLTANCNGNVQTQFCPTLESLKKYVESL